MKLVCETNGPFATRELQTVSPTLYVTRSPKGYATGSSMLDRLEKVLHPYVQYVTGRLRRPESIVCLVMDNVGAHNTPAVQAPFRRIERLGIIWLPPHTSHFLQILDASVFGQRKVVYRNLQTTPTRPKIEGKILRAFHALCNASFPGILSMAPPANPASVNSSGYLQVCERLDRCSSSSLCACRPQTSGHTSGPPDN